MAKYIKIIRNNWKKSAFACVVLSYGANYGHDQYRMQDMMRRYCEEAAILGDMPAAHEYNANRIAVILNPAADRRKAKKNFEKYCAPLLHLSGSYVTIVETTHEGHARKIPDQLHPNTTAILVAGGDGTLSETVTGLMRARSEILSVPIGVLPVGSCNTLATRLFGSTHSQAERMASATMAAIRGKTKKLNAYRVETLDGENEKPIYGVGWIEWGTWPWLKKRVKQLWYWGPFKNYLALLWPVQEALNPAVAASLAYTAPCDGCSRCYEQRPDLIAAEDRPQMAKTDRWWGAFMKKPNPNSSSGILYKNIDNDKCNHVVMKSICTTDVRLSTDTIRRQVDAIDNPHGLAPSIFVSVGNSKRYQGELLSEGLKYLKGEKIVCSDFIEAKQIEIRPENSLVKDTNEKQDVLLIDNEEFELRPIRVTVLPNSLTVFCD